MSVHDTANHLVCYFFSEENNLFEDTYLSLYNAKQSLKGI